MCTHNIILSELKWIAERIIDMGLSCKMHDGVNIFSFQHIIDQIRTAYISFHEFVVWKVLNFIQVFYTRAV